MPDVGNSNLPALPLLEALSRPRRPQLGDPCAKDLFAKLKKFGQPIQYRDLWEVVAIIAPGEEKGRAKLRRKIVATADAAASGS
jgi:hypothetical protein